MARQKSANRVIWHRSGHIPWLKKFLAHGNGVFLCRAYTSSNWWHAYVLKAQTMCFPRGKTKFIRPDGSIGNEPGHGIALLGMGAVANKALQQCGLGWFVEMREGYGIGEASRSVGNLGGPWPKDLVVFGSRASGKAVQSFPAAGLDWITPQKTTAS